MNFQSLWRRLALAVQFLTVVRVRVNDPVTADELRDSTYFFPVVGLGLGVALAATGWALGSTFTWPVVAALLVVELVVLTGALHLDGLADMCDGFYAGRDREDTLRIMKDPHIGTMGVVGLVSVLGLKAVALMNVPASRGLWVVVAAPVVARSAVLLACAVGRYAREEGTGKTYIGQLSRDHAWMALAMAVFGCTMIRQVVPAALAFVLAGVWVVLFVSYCNRRIGGLTGDTVGALNETTELIVWLAASCR
ncbi:MAG: adenosylcobinamide-GDP ribazoletransferase [Verrucomicrobia bacterium]|nr:adenosylcobinamide-GDP ribazoletransferase [Verrucomicrobiota bacterium]